MIAFVFGHSRKLSTLSLGVAESQGADHPYITLRDNGADRLFSTIPGNGWTTAPYAQDRWNFRILRGMGDNSVQRCPPCKSYVTSNCTLARQLEYLEIGIHGARSRR